MRSRGRNRHLLVGSTKVALAWAVGSALVASPQGAGLPALASTREQVALVAHGGMASFEPLMLEPLGDTGAVLVLGTNECASHLCPQLWRVAGDGPSLTRLALPPGVNATYPGSGEGVRDIVFANKDDGYITAGDGDGEHSFFTSNGGRSWRPLPAELGGSLAGVVATDTTFYGFMSKCTTTEGLEYCSYRLGRSPVGAPDWSTVPVPRAQHLLAGYISLDVYRNEAWIYMNQQTAGAAPVILKSVDGLPPFVDMAEPGLPSVTACGIALMAAAAAWVTCPTGMMVSWWRTTDGGHRFRLWWRTAGTGGDTFDPVTSTVAYRYTGDVGPGPPKRSNAQQTGA